MSDDSGEQPNSTPGAAPSGSPIESPDPFGKPADASAHIAPEVYLTAEIPGVGGRLKRHLEDFIVEEIPAYEPSGTGEHIYLFVQKVNLSTSQLVGILAKHFGVRPMDIGFAGMKDKRAITRQVVSIHTPGKRPEDFPSLLHEFVQVLWTDLHTNKLRRGHLQGNRFAIKIREIKLGSVLSAKRALDQLAAIGVPNRAGEQRFGMLANNHLIGRDLLLGRWKQACDELLGTAAMREQPGATDPEFQRVSRMLYAEGKFADAAARVAYAADTERAVLSALASGASPEQALRRMTPLQWSFFLSSLQSAVFNAVLDGRLAAGTLGKLELGDVAMKHGNGACFAVDEATLADPATAERLAKLEISPTGPMWGEEMLQAQGAVALRETAALEAFGIRASDIAAYNAREAALGKRGFDPITGARRALRMPLMYPEVEAGSDENGLFIRCSFELPPGGFATTVMQEVMKVPDVPAVGGEGQAVAGEGQVVAGAGQAAGGVREPGASAGAAGDGPISSEPNGGELGGGELSGGEPSSELIEP